MTRRLSVLLLLLGLVVLCLESSQAHSLPDQFSLMKRAPRRYCGRALTEVVRLICDGSYNKRSGLDLVYGDGQDDATNSVDEEPFQMFRQHYVQIPGPEESFRRTTRGIIDECCMKPCSITTIMSYCRL